MTRVDETALERFEPANQALHAKRSLWDRSPRASVPNSRGRYKLLTIHENITEYVTGSDKVVLGIRHSQRELRDVSSHCAFQVYWWDVGFGSLFSSGAFSHV